LATKSAYVAALHRIAAKKRSRKLARVIGNDEAPALFGEGFYGYSVLSASLDVSNHHLNLLLVLAQRFIICLRDRLEPISVLAV
jgi:hypothetical protein